MLIQIIRCIKCRAVFLWFDEKSIFHVLRDGAEIPTSILKYVLREYALTSIVNYVLRDIFKGRTSLLGFLTNPNRFDPKSQQSVRVLRTALSRLVEQAETSQPSILCISSRKRNFPPALTLSRATNNPDWENFRKLPRKNLRRCSPWWEKMNLEKKCNKNGKRRKSSLALPPYHQKATACSRNNQEDILSPGLSLRSFRRG